MQLENVTHSKTLNVAHNMSLNVGLNVIPDQPCQSFCLGNQQIHLENVTHNMTLNVALIVTLNVLFNGSLNASKSKIRKEYLELILQHRWI